MTKTLSTVLALVWLVSCMCPNVTLQVATSNESLSTVLTLVWLVSCTVSECDFAGGLSE